MPNAKMPNANNANGHLLFPELISLRFQKNLRPSFQQGKEGLRD
jgi:hypothetical protein